MDSTSCDNDLVLILISKKRIKDISYCIFIIIFITFGITNICKRGNKVDRSFFFCPRSQEVKAWTAPLCHCGRRWNCIHTVYCYRSHSALRCCMSLSCTTLSRQRRGEDSFPWLFITFTVSLHSKTRERASELRARVNDTETGKL